MDSELNIAVDLQGNVLTCQNVSSVATAPNSNSHKIGHMLDMGNVKLDTATHFLNRPDCSKCPVVFVCAGACMFLEDELFKISCNNAYFDHITFFAEALFLCTGLILKGIEADLPPERRDPFGLLAEAAL
jgi:uncharacterized protein